MQTANSPLFWSYLFQLLMYDFAVCKEFSDGWNLIFVLVKFPLYGGVIDSMSNIESILWVFCRILTKIFWSSYK